MTQEPFAKLRTLAIFFTPAAWLIMRVVDHRWHPLWRGEVDDLLCAAGIGAGVLAWVLVRCSGTVSSWRADRAEAAIRQNTQRIDGLNKVAHLFADEPRLRAVGAPDPAFEDDFSATPVSTPAGQLVPFARREDSR